MCPNVTDDTLNNSGAIYYMNGNDSTPFDWGWDNRLCEFCVFYKNETGFVKVLVKSDNSVDVYIYEDGGMSLTHKFTEHLENLKALDFASLMNKIADMHELWDRPINELNWDIDTSDCPNVDEL